MPFIHAAKGAKSYSFIYSITVVAEARKIVSDI